MSMYDDEHDYKLDGELVEDDQVINEFGAGLATHAYMPKEFLGMKTEELGFFMKGLKETPFMVLKQKLINEASTLKIEDRMQGVRYMCNIPYNNSTKHCTEAAASIIKDDSVDIYKRFYFIDNKDKFFRLSDHVVNMLHPAFFGMGLKQGAVKVPFELMIISARYILSNYGIETKIRQIALDWCLDIADNKDIMDDCTVIATLQMLRDVGQPDEQMFAVKQLKEKGLGFNDEFVLSEVDEQVRDILRALRDKHQITDKDSVQNMFKFCVQYVRKNDTEPGLLKFLEGFFANTITSNMFFENISIGEITVLIQKQYEVVRAESEVMADEIIRRFIDSAKAGFESVGELVTNLLLTLEGFVKPKVLMLTPSLYEHLRNELFAGLNQAVMQLNPALREDVELSRRSTDKSVAREFLVYFDDELDTMRKDYMKKHSITSKEFDDLANKIIEEWIN
jgi:hypothetical protein